MLILYDPTSSGPFCLLRITVVGVAGTGKSVIIDTLVTVIHEMFQCNDVTFVGAPTGTAAFNVGGEMLHRLFSILIESMKGSKDSILGPSARKFLVHKLRCAIALFIDERSMVSLRTMGLSSKHVALTAHGGHHASESWGGVPIVVMFGDDSQLPPSFGKGAFDIFIQPSSLHTAAELLGVDSFLDMTQDVMMLSSSAP